MAQGSHREDESSAPKAEQSRPETPPGTLPGRVTDDDLGVFFDMSTELYGVFGDEGLTWTNRSAERVLGYDLAELRGLALAELFHPEDVTSVQRVVDGVGTADTSRGSATSVTEVATFESRFLCKDGTWRWLEWSGALDPVTGHRYGAARDITTRRAAMDTVRKSQNLVQAILENTSAAIFVKDLSGRYVLVNEAFLHPLGLASEEVIGKTAEEIWGPGSRVEAEADVDRVVVQEGRADTRDDEVDREGDTRTIMTVRFPLRDDGGSVVGVAGIATDITERKKVERTLVERERLLDTIIRACPDIVTMVDSNGRVREVSQASARILGFDVDEPVHEELEALIHPDDINDVYLQHGRLLAREIDSLDMRYRVRHRLGHWVTLETRGQAITGEDGSVSGAVIVSRDVTGDIAFEAELEAAVQAAEAASTAKSEFLSRMSHELRTPLNSVLGFAQLMEMEQLDAGQSEAVGHILRAGHHLLSLIDEVMDIDSIESGRLELSIQPTDISAVMADAVNLTRPSAEDRHMFLSVEPGNATERPYVDADRQRLLQVLLNLLSNAVKYSEEGDSIRVQVSAVGAMTSVSVSDTGPGIDPADVDRVFRPFDRLGAERSQVEGTGVGLSVSKYMIEEMAGTLTMESAVGVGSTFTVSLPATLTPQPEKPSRHSRFASKRVAGDVRVLHIEDNAANLELVEQVLSHSPGVELVAAMYGSLGIELAKEQHPDLVLLDLHLPDMPGADVLERLQRDPSTRDIPVVVISADATPNQVHKLRNNGAVGYLTKPIDISELLHIVGAINGQVDE